MMPEQVNPSDVYEIRGGEYDGARALVVDVSSGQYDFIVISRDRQVSIHVRDMGRSTVAYALMQVAAQLLGIDPGEVARP